jgi:hypothetical protein
MYAVVISQLFNNNAIDIQTFGNISSAEHHRCSVVNALCELYPGEEFLVHEPVGVGYTAVNTEVSGGELKVWMVIKMQEITVK